METITMIIFNLLLSAGVVVPMNQDNEGRELYVLHPNVSAEVFNDIGLTILDANEDGIEGATETLSFKYFDKAEEIQSLSKSERLYIYDHCYKGEIINWIQTLEFEYNESIPDDYVIVNYEIK